MKKLLLFFVCSIIGYSSYAQTSGIILSVTDSHIGKYTEYSYFNSDSQSSKSLATKWTPGIGFNIGYQFKFNLSNKFSLNTSILGKAQNGEINSYNIVNEKIDYYNKKAWALGSSINGTINYNISSNLNIGVGIEPTVLFKTDKYTSNDHKNYYDIPLVAKVGYCLNNGMELSLQYKHGFNSIYKNDMISSPDKNKELSISLFVPLFK